MERLDETPYEHAHSDYEARFVDHDRVSHYEVPHNVHGIEEGHDAVSVDELEHTRHMPTLPSYEELLWAYQHGNNHHEGPHRRYGFDEVVHHEDVPVETLHEDFRVEHLPLFEP